MPTGPQHSHSNEQQQMEAVVIQASGPPAQSLAYRPRPVPEPGPGEVLVEVHAAAVNPLDVANAAGLLGTPLPMIPGVDFAGIVVSDGDHACQEVWGSGPALGIARPGTHARFVTLPATWLSSKPERLTMTEAAAIGRSYLAAWQTVINIMELMPGETILITGGAGMVGQAATAIARWRGADPIVADRRKPDGVDHFIDTSSTGIPEAVLDLTDGRGADAALDTKGGALFEPALRSLRFDGRMAGIFSPPEPRAVPVAEIYNRQLHVTGLASVFMDGTDVARIFDQLRPLFNRGLLVPPAIKTWPLENSAEAYQTVLDGPAGIKQVLLPAGGGRREIHSERRPRTSSRHHASPTVHTIRKETIMTTTVSLSFAALTIDAADPAALADFWGKALGRPVSPGAVAGDTAVDATGPEAGPRMILHNAPGPGTANNSIHPVLVTDHHDEETARLTALGAKPLNEINLPPAALPPGVAAVRQTTFADPEGNEFDLVTWQPE